MSQKIELVFHDDAGGQFRLSYRLAENAFARRWLTSVLLTLNRQSHFAFRATGSLFVDEAADRAKIDRAAAEVFRKSGYEVLTAPLRMYSTGQDLDPILRRCHELLGKMSDLFGKFSEARELLNQMIIDITQYKNLYAPDHHFHFDFSFKEGRRFAFEGSDFDLFTPDRRDGWLYLDSAQTGTSPFAAFLNSQSSTAEELKPVPQESFVSNFQILYRETYEYSATEKAEARAWIANRLERKMQEARITMGQIPLARPIHSYSRAEVLDRIQRFKGTVSIDAFDGEMRLTPELCRKQLEQDLKRLQHYYPYGPVWLGDLRGVISEAFAQSWRLAQPLHFIRPYAWQTWFFLSWPFRKFYYKLDYLFHVLRPYAWRAGFFLSWPLRKLYYKLDHFVRKFV